jgi:putative hemolysin
MEHTKKEVKAAAARLKRSRVANEATQELCGMVNAKSTKCAHEGCKTTPSYNYEGKTKRLFCLVHKEDGMVDVIRKSVDTKDVKHGLFIIT